VTGSIASCILDFETFSKTDKDRICRFLLVQWKLLPGFLYKIEEQEAIVRIANYCLKEDSLANDDEIVYGALAAIRTFGRLSSIQLSRWIKLAYERNDIELVLPTECIKFIQMNMSDPKLANVLAACEARSSILKFE